MTLSPPLVRAAVLLIGDELLSGRTQDTHLQTLAKFLAPLGVQVAEARVVSDVPGEISEAVKALSGKYDYLFTTGGIGPTPDDRTADAVAAAFGASIDVRADARAILEEHYKAGGLNEARLRMARIPEGASLIANPVSAAPGFQLHNVFVMAGVPSIMRGMLADIAPRIKGGQVMLSRTLRAPGLKEGDVAAGLAALEKTYPALSFGSYPWFSPEGSGAHLVARGADAASLNAAFAALMELAKAHGAQPEEVAPTA